MGLLLLIKFRAKMQSVRCRVVSGRREKMHATVAGKGRLQTVISCLCPFHIAVITMMSSMQGFHIYCSLHLSDSIYWALNASLKQ